MRVFFTSDHHFFHANIIKYCNRPFNDVDHMNAEMLSRWNETIKEEDIVLYLGDMSAGIGKKESQLRDLISSLNGRKFLIKGNHDHFSDKWYQEAGFEKVFLHLNLSGVLLLHYSLFTAPAFGVNLDNLGTVEHVIHGHTHSIDTPDHENHFNVAVDRNKFTPVDYQRAIPDHLQAQFIDSVSRLL